MDTPCALLAVAALCCFASSAAAGDAVPCAPRAMQFGTVCVCNATYCDTLPRPQRPANGTALVYTTTESGLRFHQDTAQVQQGGHAPEGPQRLSIDRNTKYQEVIGFGGAFTDAVGINLNTLPNATQDLLLRSYFSEDGIEYSLGRVPIGGTDYSTRKYSYQDHSRDKSLKEFKLQKEDYDYKIPYIKRAMAMMPADAGNLRLFAACWSPPTWMKTSHQFEGFGFLKTEYYQTYADYHMKFFDAYEKEGLTFFAFSSGNEPLNGVIPFESFNSLGWLPTTERTWVGQYLGPTLRSSNHSSLLLLAHDDQRYLLPWWLNMEMEDENYRKYVDGVAVHWYGNFITPFDILTKVHNKYPDKFIISTEASNGDKPWDFHKVMLGDWTRGLYYFGDIIKDMNHWMTGWIDWNLAVDTIGGPNWKKNYVDAAIIIDGDKGEFYKQPTYYALGHFSKFVPRGSRRVGLSSSGGPLLFGKVEFTAFQRPDGGIAVVLLNRHSKAHDVVIEDKGYGYISLKIQPNSFTTVLYW